MRKVDVRKAKIAAKKKGLQLNEAGELTPGKTAKEQVEKKEKEEPEFNENLYFPGPLRIAEALKTRFRFRTLPEIGTEKENVYFFNGQIFERAEEMLKVVAHEEFIRQWTDMLATAGEERNKALSERIKNTLNHGPSVNDINEVVAMIRRTTFSYNDLNPSYHIPFMNGLLNVETKKMEPFTPDLFYTFQVHANLNLERHITLNETPMFRDMLNVAFYEPDVPMILSYFAYCLYPDLPVHKVLFLMGRERIGKGTSIRVLQGLMPKGSGSISLARLLTSERFQFTGIEGKNLLIDSETRRRFRRGTVLDWSAFCNLFGKDVLSVEPKGKEAHDYVSKAKGIFLGNLPIFPIDSPPAIARIIIIQTRNERPKRVIPDLDLKILESERDEIATLLIQILFKLKERDFDFPGQLTDDSTATILDQLSDPVENFIEEDTDYIEGSSVSVEDAYNRFREWCSGKGIPSLTRQTFTKRFGASYPKRKLGPHGNRQYFFFNCQFSDSDVEITVNSKLQVGHGTNDYETLIISLSGERYRRVQHVSHDPSQVREKNYDHDNMYKGNVHKLDTGVTVSRNPENTGPSDIKSVSNFEIKNNTVLQSNDTKLSTELLNSPLQSEPNPESHDPITFENGNLIRDQLLNLGYIIDPNSGKDLNEEYYKIGIIGVSARGVKLDKLSRIMQGEKFDLFNDLNQKIIWYKRPLWRDQP